jgi:acetyl esterase/lipase
MTDIQASDPISLWGANAVPGALSDGDEDRPQLTPWLPRSAGRRSAMIVCPGGGYARRAPHEGAPVAEWLASRGHAAFVLDYRVAPYRHPWPLADALRAIRLVRAHAEEWQVDPKRVGILGFSAGGHVACSAATLFDRVQIAEDDLAAKFSARPDAVVGCYPVISFGAFAHEGCRNNLLGPDADPAAEAMLSLENSVSERTPPAFIWHSFDDPAVPVENALLFAEALSTVGVPVELHIFARAGGHGIGMGTDDNPASAWTSLCARWLETVFG